MDEHFPPIIRRWLGEQRGGADEDIDHSTKQAADICGRSQRASGAAKGAEPVNRKERTRYHAALRPLEENALRLWSQNNGFWIDEFEFIKMYGSRRIGAEAGQTVYLHQDSYSVVKVNTGNYHGHWLEFFNRRLCHAMLFSSTK